MERDQIDIVRSNIRKLMVLHKTPSENALSTKAKVSQKTINNLLAVDSIPNPTAKVLINIAAYYKVAPWMLWIEDFPFESLSIKPLKKMTHEGYRLLSAFESLSDDKRKSILDFVLYQIRDETKTARNIEDARANYKAQPRPTEYPTCKENFE